MDTSARLSAHLSAAEFVATDVERLRSLNCEEWWSNPAVQVNASRFALLFERARCILGVPLVVSSGFRCPALNAAVGGQPTSHHLLGLAADVVPQGMTVLTAMRALVTARDLLPELDLAIFEKGRWIHLQAALSSAKPRHAFLAFDGNTYFVFNEHDSRIRAQT